MTALCSDCPDHEACMTNWPCAVVRANNEGTDTARSAHVRRSPVSHARADLGDVLSRSLAGFRVVFGRYIPWACVSEPDRTVFLPQHSVEAEDVITAELVACTLGARSRPELVAHG